MAGKIGKGVYAIYAELQSMFSTWKEKAAQGLALYGAGTEVSADIIYNVVYHDARRTLEQIQGIITIVTTKNWAAQLREVGVTQQGAGYDILLEGQALKSNLIALQSAAITALGGVDASGYMIQPYAKMSNTAPFFRKVQPIEYAGLIPILQAIDVSIVE